MVLMVNTAFKKFCDNTVNLQPNQTELARTSRDWLLTNIAKLGTRGLIPALYKEKILKYGSFARRTKIRPLDDIDLMLCYKGYGGLYRVVEENKTYAIYYDNIQDEPLKSLCDGKVLNSRKVIENLKNQLACLSGYSKAEFHRNQEAVTLKMSSYSWNFDIVPCFYTTTGFYLIPNGNGNWKKTDPRVDNNRTLTLNKQKDGQVLPWIRIMKYWRNLPNNPWDSLSSYAYEQLLLDLAEQMEFDRSIADLVSAALNLQALAITKPIMDPKGMQGDLNQLTDEVRLKLKEFSEKHSHIADLARLDELFCDNPKDAIIKWKIIFGEDFPNFG